MSATILATVDMLQDVATFAMMASLSLVVNGLLWWPGSRRVRAMTFREAMRGTEKATDGAMWVSIRAMKPAVAATAVSALVIVIAIMTKAAAT